jgi:hypothetical protein
MRHPSFDAGNPKEVLADSMPWLNIFGGCCGSDCATSPRSLARSKEDVQSKAAASARTPITPNTHAHVTSEAAKASRRLVQTQTL